MSKYTWTRFTYCCKTIGCGSGAAPGHSERKKKGAALQGGVGLVDLYGAEWSDLSNKKGLLSDLKASTSLSPQELERIYNAFTKVVQ